MTITISIALQHYPSIDNINNMTEKDINSLHKKLIQRKTSKTKKDGKTKSPKFYVRDKLKEIENDSNILKNTKDLKRFNKLNTKYATTKKLNKKDMKMLKGVAHNFNLRRRIGAATEKLPRGHATLIHIEEDNMLQTAEATPYQKKQFNRLNKMRKHPLYTFTDDDLKRISNLPQNLQSRIRNRKNPHFNQRIHYNAKFRYVIHVHLLNILTFLVFLADMIQPLSTLFSQTQT